MLRHVYTSLLRPLVVRQRFCGYASGAKKIANDKVLVTFKTAEDTFEVQGTIGESLLDVVVNKDVPLDGFGACEGTLACCTCHVVLTEEHFDRLAKPEEEELDMLDLAPELTDQSRLGCQVILTKEDKPGVVVKVPSVTRDARSL
uniref:2Fe-2S ferredoxin-type domain-containing protein n=1 Tax=Panagrellus redivivus TaxID=6233 RepID=A0A7E4VPW5_PANRE